MLSFTPRLTTGRLVLLGGLALCAVMLFSDLAFAQEGAAPAPSEGPAKKKNIIVHMIESVGWVFGPMILAISISLVALIVVLFLDLRMSSAIPVGFVDDFTDTVNKRKFKEAFEMARNDPSFLGRVLTAGMSRLQYGLEDARETAMNTLESIKSDKEQKNNYTAVIASVGPMIGLVGTVYGMIESFMALEGATGAPNASALAGGISHALVVTLLGIGMSIPAIFFNAFFRNRITRLTMDVSHIADDLLTQMYHNSKKPAAGSMAPPTGAAAASAGVGGPQPGPR